MKAKISKYEVRVLVNFYRFLLLLIILSLPHFLQYIKFQGYHSAAKVYPGKVALSTLAKLVRNKVIIDIGNFDM